MYVSATTTETRLLGNYVNGAWIPAISQQDLDVRNPANGEVLARVPLSSRADVDAAVAAARAAYPDWRKRSVIERGRWLFRFRAGARGPSGRGRPGGHA